MKKWSLNNEKDVRSDFPKAGAKAFGWPTPGEWRALLALFLLPLLPAAARASSTNNLDLSEVPLEQLLNMDVTILRGHDTLSKTPAAISIVTADDIRRSGAMSIPEALRQVPGMDVAQVNSSAWSVSARG